jgi:hypothetical protein
LALFLGLICVSLAMMNPFLIPYQRVRVGEPG